MMGGRRPASGAGSYFNASSNPRVAATGHIALLASTDEIARQAQDGRSDQQSISQFLVKQKERLPGVAYLRAMTRTGDVIYGPDVPFPPVNNSDRDYFIKMRDDRNAGLLIRNPVIGHIAGKLLWSFVRRINKYDGSFDGIVIAAVYINKIDEILARIKMPPGVSITLRNSDLALIARYHFLEDIPDPTGDSQISKEFMAAINKNPEEGTYTSSATTSRSGIDGTHSYVRSAKYGFTINVGISHRTSFAEWGSSLFHVGSLSSSFPATR